MSSPPAASPTPAAAEEITLAFAGDLHFHDRTRRLLNTPETAVGPFSEQLRAADFTMVNLETAITERGTEVEPKRLADDLKTVPVHWSSRT